MTPSVQGFRMTIRDIDLVVVIINNIASKPKRIPAGPWREASITECLCHVQDTLDNSCSRKVCKAWSSAYQKARETQGVRDKEHRDCSSFPRMRNRLNIFLIKFLALGFRCGRI